MTQNDDSKLDFFQVEKSNSNGKSVKNDLDCGQVLQNTESIDTLSVKKLIVDTCLVSAFCYILACPNNQISCRFVVAYLWGSIHGSALVASIQATNSLEKLFFEFVAFVTIPWVPFTINLQQFTLLLSKVCFQEGTLPIFGIVYYIKQYVKKNIIQKSDTVTKGVEESFYHDYITPLEFFGVCGKISFETFLWYSLVRKLQEKLNYNSLLNLNLFTSNTILNNLGCYQNQILFGFAYAGFFFYYHRIYSKYLTKQNLQGLAEDAFKQREQLCILFSKIQFFSSLRSPFTTLIMFLNFPQFLIVRSEGVTFNISNSLQLENTLPINFVNTKNLKFDIDLDYDLESDGVSKVFFSLPNKHLLFLSSTKMPKMEHIFVRNLIPDILFVNKPNIFGYNRIVAKQLDGSAMDYIIVEYGDPGLQFQTLPAYDIMIEEDLLGLPAPSDENFLQDITYWQNIIVEQGSNLVNASITYTSQGVFVTNDSKIGLLIPTCDYYRDKETARLLIEQHLFGFDSISSFTNISEKNSVEINNPLSESEFDLNSTLNESTNSSYKVGEDFSLLFSANKNDVISTLEKHHSTISENQLKENLLILYKNFGNINKISNKLSTDCAINTSIISKNQNKDSVLSGFEIIKNASSGAQSNKNLSVEELLNLPKGYFLNKYCELAAKEFASRSIQVWMLHNKSSTPGSLSSEFAPIQAAGRTSSQIAPQSAHSSGSFGQPRSPLNSPSGSSQSAVLGAALSAQRAAVAAYNSVPQANRSSTVPPGALYSRGSFQPSRGTAYSSTRSSIVRQQGSLSSTSPPGGLFVSTDNFHRISDQRRVQIEAQRRPTISTSDVVSVMNITDQTCSREQITERVLKIYKYTRDTVPANRRAEINLVIDLFYTPLQLEVVEPVIVISNDLIVEFIKEKLRGGEEMDEQADGQVTGVAESNLQKHIRDTLIPKIQEIEQSHPDTNSIAQYHKVLQLSTHLYSLVDLNDLHHRIVNDGETINKNLLTIRSEIQSLKDYIKNSPLSSNTTELQEAQKKLDELFKDEKILKNLQSKISKAQYQFFGIALSQKKDKDLFDFISDLKTDIGFFELDKIEKSNSRLTPAARIEKYDNFVQEGSLQQYSKLYEKIKPVKNEILKFSNSLVIIFRMKLSGKEFLFPCDVGFDKLHLVPGMKKKDFEKISKDLFFKVAPGSDNPANQTNASVVFHASSTVTEEGQYSIFIIKGSEVLTLGFKDLAKAYADCDSNNDEDKKLLKENLEILNTLFKTVGAQRNIASSLIDINEKVSPENVEISNHFQINVLSGDELTGLKNKVIFESPEEPSTSKRGRKPTASKSYKELTVVEIQNILKNNSSLNNVLKPHEASLTTTSLKQLTNTSISVLFERFINNNSQLIKSCPNLQKVSPVIASLTPEVETFVNNVARHDIAANSKTRILGRIVSNSKLTLSTLEVFNAEMVDVVVAQEALTVDDQKQLREALNAEYEAEIILDVANDPVKIAAEIEKHEAKIALFKNLQHKRQLEGEQSSTED